MTASPQEAQQARAAKGCSRLLLHVAAVLVGAAIILMVIAEIARAAESESFGIEPSPVATEEGPRRTFGFEIAAGASARDAVRVFNTTDRRVSVRLYGAGVEFVKDHHEVAGYAQRAAGSGGWVRLDQEIVDLEPRAQRVVGFSVSVPDGAAPGEQLAAVAAEPVAGRSAGGLDLVPRLAILVRLQVEHGDDDNPIVPVVLASLGLGGGVAAYVWHRARRLS